MKDPRDIHTAAVQRKSRSAGGFSAKETEGVREAEMRSVPQRRPSNNWARQEAGAAAPLGGKDGDLAAHWANAMATAITADGATAKQAASTSGIAMSLTKGKADVGVAKREKARMVV